MGLAESLLVSLVNLVDRIPMPPASRQRPRGRPRVDSDRLLITALVVMLVRRLYTAGALVAFLDQSDPVVQQVRVQLTEHGRVPPRRTWERRWAALPTTLPSLIGCLGRQLVKRLNPWQYQGRGAAVDRTGLRAHGGVWHKADRQQGRGPHPSIETEAAWSRSGWQGWWYGGKLPLAVPIGRLGIPLAAEFTPAKVAETVVASGRLTELPAEVRYVLGDPHYQTLELRAACALQGRELVATRRGPYPPTEGGADVRRLFHKLRSQAIEPFTGLFQNIFEWGGQMPVTGVCRCRLLALGAIVLYQLVLRYQHEQNLAPAIGVKALLQAV